MKKPPAQTKSQHGYKQTAVRMPPELHEEIKATAELNGRRMNAEIIDRLQQNNMATLLRENAELKKMIREILDIVRDKL